VKTILPELTTHFDEDMIVLEKWIPKKPISAIYFDGEKEKFFVKRFIIENENKEELFISNHKNSNLEIVSTDWKPMVEVEFTKERGKDRKDNLVVNLEQFITIKGITALGNQLTKEKVNQINLLDPLPYEPPEETPANEIEVIDETEVSGEISNEIKTEVSSEEPKKASKENNKKANDSLNDKGQITLF
jgi:topoisomerase-4 subunit A